jgi:hypothetical protein
VATKATAKKYLDFSGVKFLSLLIQNYRYENLFHFMFTNHFIPFPTFLKSQEKNEEQIVFSNVRIFDGNSPTLSKPLNVYIKDNKIEKIDAKPIV